ncbi:MAG: hypothetical protein R3254_05950 [Thiomicrorhabdus sp.]|nr:hypothetical protein [Thiomicrorhabdus sp.]
MYKTVKTSLMILFVMAFANSANAGLWDDTKEMASEAWQSTKETSVELKEGAVEKWHEVTSRAQRSDGDDSENETGSLSDIKKLADKETYVQAWQDIKNSASNPQSSNDDEFGIPKQD